MTTTIKTTELTLTRLIPATPAEVFGAWMDPRHPGNPWTGAKKLILDGRVDGLFYFLHLADGRRTGHDAPLALVAAEPWAHYGRFIAIEPNQRIQYAWMSPFTRGLESVVTVAFEKKGEDTLVMLNHANLPEEMGSLHERGWNYCFNQFSEKFTAGRRR